MTVNKPIVLGIAGGSGSGKTTLSRAVVKEIGAENVSYLCHDCYYRDLSHLPMDKRGETNFDHPDALETSLMAQHLARLKAGFTVEVPTYDFKVHSRKAATIRTEPRRVIIVEGILIFCDPCLRDKLDVKIFVDTVGDIRFIRRMKRDLAERNRTVDEVVGQYLATVRPMHELYVQPSQKYSDIIVHDSLNTVVLDMITARLRAHDAHVEANGGSALSNGDVGAVAVSNEKPTANSSRDGEGLNENCHASKERTDVAGTGGDPAEVIGFV